MKIKAETISGDLIEIEQKDLRWRVSAYGVLVENNQILLLKNALTKSELFLPGGEVEINEDIPQAIKREFVEEVGISVEVDSMIYYRESFFKGPRQGAFHSIQLFFNVKKIKAIKNTVTDKHVRDVQWYSLNQLSSLSLAPQIKFLNSAQVLNFIR